MKQIFGSAFIEFVKFIRTTTRISNMTNRSESTSRKALWTLQLMSMTVSWVKIIFHPRRMTTHRISRPLLILSFKLTKFSCKLMAQIQGIALFPISGISLTHTETRGLKSLNHRICRTRTILQLIFLLTLCHAGQNLWNKSAFRLKTSNQSRSRGLVVSISSLSFSQKSSLSFTKKCMIATQSTQTRSGLPRVQSLNQIIATRNLSRVDWQEIKQRLTWCTRG